jgi:heptosyltransferase-2
VLTTPLIAELAMRGPVDVVVTPAAAPLLANNPGIRHLFVYDKRGDDGGLSGLWWTAQRLRGRRNTLPPAPARRERRAARTAYLAQGSVRSAMLALLAGCRERVGFASSAGRLFYTRRVPFRADRHHAERLWRLAFARQPSVEPPAGALRPRVYPSADDVAAVERLLAGAGVREPFVALAPGSVWATKRWPYYADLARRLARDVRVVVVGSAADAEAARAIAERAAVIDATGRLSLLASAELIGRAAALVTNDSLPQHLASAAGTPTVTLFGPTVPEFGFGPLAPRSAALGVATLPCRPCHHHGPPRCPLGHWRCMRELDVESVARSLTATLG